MSKSVISVRNVSLSFPRKKGALGWVKSFFSETKNDKFQALREVSFEVHKGEVLGIIGRNGSGKSTILRVITGILPADSGEVQSSGNHTLLSSLGTGFSAHQTGRENAIIFGIILGYSKQEISEKMDEIIQFSELGPFIDEPIRTYSAGMKARLGLAVAGAICPDILLIDEVLGVGDPKFREKSKKRILDMVGDAGTVVLVSHSFGLMKSICDRVIHLHKGEIAYVGAPEGAIQSYYEMED
tara:strand:- start:7860 stop:8582 length:723 start_codon:yes stop_codon:yes gene_type:complete